MIGAIVFATIVLVVVGIVALIATHRWLKTASPEHRFLRTL
jgi:hypothetical protein